MNVYNESNTKINAQYTHCIAVELIMSVKTKKKYCKSCFFCEYKCIFTEIHKTNRLFVSQKKPTVFGDTKFLRDTQIYYALTSITELMTLRPCGDTLISSLSLEISER